jgi:hypothetical protein
MDHLEHQNGTIATGDGPLPLLRMALSGTEADEPASGGQRR